MEKSQQPCSLSAQSCGPGSGLLEARSPSIGVSHRRRPLSWQGEPSAISGVRWGSRTASSPCPPRCVAVDVSCHLAYLRRPSTDGSNLQEDAKPVARREGPLYGSKSCRVPTSGRRWFKELHWHGVRRTHRSVHQAAPGTRRHRSNVRHRDRPSPRMNRWRRSGRRRRPTGGPAWRSEYTANSHSRCGALTIADHGNTCESGESHE
jgi:hypothetical protein